MEVLLKVMFFCWFSTYLPPHTLWTSEYAKMYLICPNPHFFLFFSCLSFQKEPHHIIFIFQYNSKKKIIAVVDKSEIEIVLI